MLSHDDQLKSIRAIKKAISPLESFMGVADILVIKNGSEILSLSDIEIQTGYEANYMQYRVSIYWERSVPNYQSLGLRGSYNTNFNLMQCRSGSLIIHADDHDVIITT